jgi:hypothetical protein
MSEADSHMLLSKIALDFVNAEERLSIIDGAEPCLACNHGTLQWFRFPQYGTLRVICTNPLCVDVHCNMGTGHEVKH